MNAKDFLMRPNQLDCNMKMIATDILVLRCQAEKISAVLSPVVGGKGANKDFSVLVDQIIEYEVKLERLTADWIQATKVVQAVIEMLPNPKKRTVLHKRYLENKTLVQIAGEINYSEQYVRKLHSNAINEVQEIINNKLMKI